jgi:hypothetical protein
MSNNAWNIIDQYEIVYTGNGTGTLTLPTITTTAGDYLWVMATSIYNNAPFTVTGGGNTFTNMITLPTTVGQPCTQGFFVPSCNGVVTSISISNTSPILSAGVWEITQGPNGGGAGVGSAAILPASISASPLFYAIFCPGGQVELTQSLGQGIWTPVA